MLHRGHSEKVNTLSLDLSRDNIDLVRLIVGHNWVSVLFGVEVNYF